MAAGAWTTCFEWSHLSLELDPHEELPVSFRASLIFLIILHPLTVVVHTLRGAPVVGLA